METTKIDKFTIEVTKDEVVTKTNTYDVNFLVRQKADIQQSLDEFTAARMAELAEVDELLGHCDKLGIVAKPPEPKPEEGVL